MTKIILKNINGVIYYSSNNNHIKLGTWGELIKIPRGTNIRKLNLAFIKEKILGYISIRDIPEKHYASTLEFLTKESSSKKH